MNRQFTLMPSPISAKDWYYTKVVKSVQNLPTTMTLEKYCGPIKNQGDAGFCHSFAGSSLKDIQEQIETGVKYNLSPLYLARTVKSIDELPDEEGSTLLDVCKALKQEGTIKEVYYPYEQYEAGSLKFPKLRYSKVYQYKIQNYARCDTVESMKQAIFNKKPVLFGITCCSNIYDLDNNADKFIALPEGAILGGHAMVIVGYDDNLSHTYKNGKTCKGFFRIQNSWGTDWGDNGFAYLPYEYFTYKINLIADKYMTFFTEAWAAVDLKNDNINIRTIVMQINNTTAKVDGKKITLNQEPIIDKKTYRTLVPLRDLAEIFDFTVEWDDSTKTITISKELE